MCHAESFWPQFCAKHHAARVPVAARSDAASRHIPSAPLPAHPEAGHVYMPERGDRHQPPCGFVFTGAAGDLSIKFGDPLFEVIEYRHQHAQRSSDRLWQIRALDFDECKEPTSICCPLRHDLFKLRQMTTQGVDRLCPLSGQKLADTKYGRSTLRFLALRCDEAPSPPLSRFAGKPLPGDGCKHRLPGNTSSAWLRPRQWLPHRPCRFCST